MALGKTMLSRSGALTALILVGCGSAEDGEKGACAEEPCLEAPANGFQLRSLGAAIQPGEDVEYCELLQLPGTADDVFTIDRFELAMTEGSHHLTVTALETLADSPELRVGERRPCKGGEIFGGHQQHVTGSQLAYYEEVFPPGIGRIYRGGQYVVFDYHYLNLEQSPIWARAAVNFHLTDGKNVQRIAKGLGFHNFTIETPPHDRASFVGECAFTRDLLVHKLVRHTHQWGTDYRVWFAGGARAGETVFSSAHYEETDHRFEQPLLMRAGEGFRFQCDYFNDTNEPLKFGLGARDEMCILYGTWWEPALGDPIETQVCYLTEVGDDGVARSQDPARQVR